MKQSLKAPFCRIIAAVFLGAGAFLLVAVYLPVINPGVCPSVMDEQGRMVHVGLTVLGENAQPCEYYLLGTPLSLLLLAAAWYFNIKGTRLHAK